MACRLRNAPLSEAIPCVFERVEHIFYKIAQSSWHVLASPGRATAKEWLITALALMVAFGLTYMVTAFVFVMMALKNIAGNEKRQLY
jgi:hypothetical protein